MDSTPTANTKRYFSVSSDGTQLLSSTSKERPPTLLPDGQGDHVSAFALTKICIVNEANNNFQSAQEHITPFVTSIFSRSDKDADALESLGLYIPTEALEKEISEFLFKLQSELSALITPTIVAQVNRKPTIALKLDALHDALKEPPPKRSKNDQRTGSPSPVLVSARKQLKLLKVKNALIGHVVAWGQEFAQFSFQINALRETYNQDIMQSLRECEERGEILKAAYDLDEEIKKDEKVAKLLQSMERLRRQDEDSKITRQKIRHAYFSNTVRELSDLCLVYQNEMPYVTFARMRTLSSKDGESAEIKMALQFLEAYNKGESRFTDIQMIINNIKNLLFFEKLKSEEQIREAEKAKEDFLTGNKTKMLSYLGYRDNDENVFIYVVARHWTLVSETFLRLSLDPAIKENFINSMLDDWGFAPGNEREVCRQKIDQVIKIYQKPPTATLDDLSLQGSQQSPLLPGSVSEDENLSAQSGQILPLLDMGVLARTQEEFSQLAKQINTIDQQPQAEILNAFEASVGQQENVDNRSTPTPQPPPQEKNPVRQIP